MASYTNKRFLHSKRPFISDGHLRSSSTPENSWKKCTVAARNITSIVGAYRSAYSLRGAPYLTSYAVYVSCTIHVRNAALEGGSGENLKLLLSGLKTLDELCVPNPGVSGPANIIRRLMQTNGILEVSSKYYHQPSAIFVTPDPPMKA